MQPVFISHSSDDRYFVNLLVALLEYHGVKTWCSTDDIKGSHQYRDEIDRALEKAESLIVVVSSHSADSKWVIKEFVRFQTLKPKGAVLPLILDDTDLSRFVDGMEAYQTIDFRSCMKTGFEKVMAVFGKTFLPYEKKKNMPKDQDRRNKSKERRSSDLTQQRLRVGFQLCYTRAVSLGQFNPARLVSETLADEALKYRYFDDKGTEHEPRNVLQVISEAVWKDATEEERGNIPLLVERIARKISEQYSIQSMDRRKIQD
ncbi:toll/interleukin-1 receptor domain-containing protein [bacterium]|nr:toll/interleukin-1 receptor domain-containing protein [bacterium]